MAGQATAGLLLASRGGRKRRLAPAPLYVEPRRQFRGDLPLQTPSSFWRDRSVSNSRAGRFGAADAKVARLARTLSRRQGRTCAISMRRSAGFLHPSGRTPIEAANPKDRKRWSGKRE